MNHPPTKRRHAPHTRRGAFESMHKFVRSLITEWRRLDLPFTDDAIVVAVSGGADSMSLLTGIRDLVERKKLHPRVIVAHFNHKLRGAESETDEEFVRQHSADAGFEFVRGSARLPANGNLEQAAREARYKFLCKVAGKYNSSLVLAAHTQNDQAETFLMNLIRGSGPDGLTGMKTARALNDQVQLIRPLLSWATRSDTEIFCRENNVAFRTDSMNDDQRFTRVRIRKTVLPMLANLNPRIVEALAGTAELIGDRTRTESTSPCTIPDELALRDLRSLSQPDLYSRLRSWLRLRRGNLRSLERKHIEAIERLISSGKSGKTVELPGRGRVVKHNGLLAFSNIKVDK